MRSARERILGAHLCLVLREIDARKHGKHKRSGLACAGLGLANHVDRTGKDVGMVVQRDGRIFGLTDWITEGEARVLGSWTAWRSAFGTVLLADPHVCADR